ALRQREVKRLIGKRHVLGACLDQRKLEPELLLALMGCLQLRRGDVDAHWTRPSLREPSREVGSSAAELDDVHPRDVRQRTDLRLRLLKDTPANLVLRPGLTGLLTGVRGILGSPDIAVAGGVGRKLRLRHRRTRARSR